MNEDENEDEKENALNELDEIIDDLNDFMARYVLSDIANKLLGQALDAINQAQGKL